MSDENEFIDWQGGRCPVYEGTAVDVHLSSGGVIVNRAAGELDWQRNSYGGDIIAYRVIEPPKVEIPEGFTPWSGGERPIGSHDWVELLLRNGVRLDGELFEFDWAHAGSEGDIIAYRLVEAEEKPKVDIPEGFAPWQGGSCPVYPEVRVQLLFRNGEMLKFSENPTELRWSNTGGESDIIAYRVIGEEKPKVARDTQVAGTHYKTAAVQPWDVVDTWHIEQQIGFYRGNVLKYTMRMGTKDDDLTEIRKAGHYLQKLVEVLEQKGGA